MIIGAASLASFFGALIWWSTDVRNKREAVWRAVADTRGGVFHEAGSSWLVAKPAVIEAVIGQAVVHLDTYVVSSGKSSTTYTRARAVFSLGSGPSFKVYKEGVLSSIGKAIGTQDLELGGDKGFDDAFMVKGDDVAAVREAWTSKAKGLMFGQLHDTRAVSDGDDVVLTCHGAVSDPSKLTALLDLAGELASYGARALVDYGSLPDARATATTLTRGFALEIGTKAGPVAVTARVTRGPVGLTLTLDHSRELPEFATELARGQASDLPRGLLADHGQGRLESVGEARLVSDSRQRLRLSWPGLPDHVAVSAGVELLVELAAGVPTEGAFR